MLIIGIDPGTLFTGFGIIKFNNNNLKKIDSGVIELSKSKSLPDKLKSIYDKLEFLISEYKPDEFVIETAFYGKNIQSTLKIGYARGVSILSAANNNLPVYEYSPREVKKSVAGRGAASKQQVGFMVKQLLNLDDTNLKFDETDALAVALCHIFKLKSFTGKSKSWSDFVLNHPERIIS